MNAILTTILASRAFVFLCMLVIAAMMAFVVQGATGLSADPVLPAKYCHFWCNEYGQCFWGCD